MIRALHGEKITKIDRSNKFMSVFDPKSGLYIRTGVIENGVDTGVDPFMTDFPELIDIGIMGRCRNAAHCKVGCYQGRKADGENMSYEDYSMIMDQCEGRVFQVALGGAGSPDEHERFGDILRRTRDARIVPNYTTAGIGVDESVAALTKEYCGAVAVSWYDMPYTSRAISHFLNAGCKTNIHYVLSQDSIADATRRLEQNDFPEGINAVIFLAHKPVGCGSQDQILTNNQEIERFFEAVTAPHPFKVGFDSCTVPAIINYASDRIRRESIDTCEGGRWSCYISADMVIVPCSFDQQRKHGVSLREHTIHEAWHSEQFNQFRNHFQTSCPDCKDRNDCMGGCPIVNEVVLCKRPERIVLSA